MFSKPLTERLRPSLSGLTNGQSTGPQIDFSQVPAINARDIFHESVHVPATTLRGYVKLLDALPASVERNQLLYEYLTLCDRLDDFLAHKTSDRVRELERQHRELWTRCRAKEDDVKTLSADAARCDQQANQAGFALGEACAKVMEAVAGRPGTDTNFPTEEEIQAYQVRCQTAADTRYQREQELADMKRYYFSARQHEQKARSELIDLLEQVKLLDAELTQLRQR
jgi:hypothetical protein